MISFVGTETASGDLGSGGPLTIDTPGGATEDTVLLASITSTTSVRSAELEPGWVLLTSLSFSSRSHTFLYYVCGLSIPASHNFPLGLTVSSNAGAILAFDNVDPATPINTYDGSTDTGSTCDMSSLTTTADGCMLVGTLGGEGSATAWTPPGSMTEASDVDGVNVTDATAYELLGAQGATGGRTFTGTASGNTAFVIVALNPRLFWHVGFVGSRG